MGDLKF